MLSRSSRRIALMSAAVVCIGAFPLASALLGEEPAPPNPAIHVLQGLDRASRLYLDAALRFACEEQIVEQTPGTKHSWTFDYMYVYDEAKGYQDYRTRGGKSKPVDPESAGVRQFLARGSMWVL